MFHLLPTFPWASKHYYFSLPHLLGGKQETFAFTQGFRHYFIFAIITITQYIFKNCNKLHFSTLLSKTFSTITITFFSTFSDKILTHNLEKGKNDCFSPKNFKEIFTRLGQKLRYVVKVMYWNRPRFLITLPVQITFSRKVIALHFFD